MTHVFKPNLSAEQNSKRERQPDTGVRHGVVPEKCDATTMREIILPSSPSDSKSISLSMFRGCPRVGAALLAFSPTYNGDSPTISSALPVTLSPNFDQEPEQVESADSNALVHQSERKELQKEQPPDLN